jgi:hypothetical protein
MILWFPAQIYQKSIMNTYFGCFNSPMFGPVGSMLRVPVSLTKMDQASLWLMHDSSTAPLMHTMGGSTFAFASLETDECHIMAIHF